jgi:Holliday junction resolvase RusA-like endonuclease
MIRELTVNGTPVPQGSKVVYGRHPVEANKQLRPWRAHVCMEARTAAGPRLNGPLVGVLAFTLRRPTSARKRDHHPIHKPDLDKLVRAIFDALVDAGWLEDDAQVVELNTTKRWVGEPQTLEQPGVWIYLEEVGEA